LTKQQTPDGQAVQVSVTVAKRQLTDLVRRAEAGEDVILTRHGHAVVRLVPVKRTADRKSRKALLETIGVAVSGKATAGPDAPRSPDFLYGDDGLPR
jgi:prevent-host-death family protein